MIPEIGRLTLTRHIARPKRMRASERKALALRVQDAAIAQWDRQGMLRRHIAMITNLSESQVYRRLAAIRANKAEARRYEDGEGD